MTEHGPIGLQAAPLSLPAILLNPRSRAQVQIEAYNAQQRESRAAKRAASSASNDEFGMRRKGEGKRSLRRRENAQMVFNPHRRNPAITDYVPSTSAGGGRAQTSNFVLPGGTPKAIRSTEVPSPLPPISELTSTVAGQYTLSLKGVRQLLRKRGRRAEVVVGICEKELRYWVLSVGAIAGGGSGHAPPKIIDSTPVDTESSASIVGKGALVSHGTLAEATPAPEGFGQDSGPTRSLPAAFSTSPASSPEHLSIVLHSFCNSSALVNPPGQAQKDSRAPPVPFPNPTNRPSPAAAQSRTTGKNEIHKRPAIVELVHSPGHLVWAVADPFERLVVHLLCRYYDLISFSQTLPCMIQDDGTRTPAYRITHILKPSHLNPTQPATFDLMTPENTDLDTDTAGGSASEGEPGFGAASGFLTASESESEAAGPMRGRSMATEVTRPEIMNRNFSMDSDWSRAESDSASRAGSDSEFSVDDVVWQPISTGGGYGGQIEFASTNVPSHVVPNGGNYGAPSHAGDSDFSDDADADASDMDSIAGSSAMLDSLIIGTAGEIGSWTRTAESAPDCVAGLLPQASGFQSTTMDKRRMSLGSNAPFVSEFNLPVDLFPARRIGLGPGKDKVEKPSFFEYLYG